MSLLTKIKSVLGLGDGGSERGRDFGDQTVTFGGPPDEEPARRERTTPATETERAVKEPGAEADQTGAVDVGESSVDAAEEPGGVESASEATASAADAEEASDPVTDVKGIGPAYAERLAEAGVENIADLAGANAESLEAATDISANRIQRWIDRAQAH